MSDAPVRAGLEKAKKLPTGSGYVDVTAVTKLTPTTAEGVIRAELGWHPKDGVTAFAYGQGAVAAGRGTSAEAGAGLRWEF